MNEEHKLLSEKAELCSWKLHCYLILLHLQNILSKLKVAIIGQSTFAAEVYKLLRNDGHKVVGVFTVPDKGNREDPLGK